MLHRGCAFSLCLFHALPGLGQPFGQRGRPGRHGSASFGQSGLIHRLSTTLGLVRWLTPVMSAVYHPLQWLVIITNKALAITKHTSYDLL